MPVEVSRRMLYNGKAVSQAQARVWSEHVQGERMTEHTNLEDYADPVLFDIENSEFEPDGPFYLSLAQQVAGSVLELGCGTGRITIPLAQHSIDIVGLDVVPGMIAQAKGKAGDLPIRWVEADVRDFHLGQQFDLICAPGAVFEHLLERADQEAMLACVREHLAPEGLFASSILFPHPARMVNSEEEQEWFSYVDEAGREVRVTGTDRYDPVRQIREETAYRRWHDAEGREVTRRARLALRLVFPQEMDSLLHYNGFTVLHRYGDWDSGPLTDQSRCIIHVCKKALS
jgi:SAM-dependent methyltransferase